MSASAKSPTWTEYVGFAALLLFALAIPFFAFYGALTSVPWFGAQSQPGDRQEQYTWLMVGLASNVLAIVLAAVAAGAGKRPARVLAAITLPIALVGVVILGLLAKGTADMLPDEPPAAVQPEYPSCGPDSRPTVYGGDDRYTPCDDAVATARDLVPTITAALPTTDVTPATVDSAAAALAEQGVDGYDSALAYENGDLAAAWAVAPVTCVVALWRDGTWQLSVEGLLADGGCIYRAT